MIKGINRQMIEVTDTGNAYFERALLVVRPGCTDTEEEGLRAEAHRMLRTLGGYGGLKKCRRRRRLQKLVGGILCTATGTGLGMLLAQLLP